MPPPLADSGSTGTYPWHSADQPLRAEFVAVLASWPDLPDPWWQDEAFVLQAAALGYDGPAKPIAKAADGDNRAEWLALAQAVLDRQFHVEPADASTLKSLEIGFRAFPSEPLCREALGKIETITPAKWRKADLCAGRLLPR